MSADLAELLGTQETISLEFKQSGKNGTGWVRPSAPRRTTWPGTAAETSSSVSARGAYRWTTSTRATAVDLLTAAVLDEDDLATLWHEPTSPA